MHLDDLRGKQLLLLGKSRALPSGEFESQLQNHGIVLTREPAGEIALIAEGRLMNPIEQELHDELYAKGVAPIVSVDEVEKLLCSEIDADRLMMSLKLSNDPERLKGFLQNRLIDDALFLRLLGLYDWQGEGFFENDDNRDVTAALIERFYANIERNHNVQYATLGLMHLIVQTQSADLLEAVAQLQPLQLALKGEADKAMMQILQAIAVHPACPQSVLRRFVKSGEKVLCILVAGRGDIEAALQQKLLAMGDDEVTAALAANAALAESVFESLFAEGGHMPQLAASVRLDETRYAKLFGEAPAALAANPTLDAAMQQRLIETGESTVLAALAANTALNAETAGHLYETGGADAGCILAQNPSVPAALLAQLAKEGVCLAAIASNEKAPAVLLEQLAQSDDIAVLTALAKNPATPVAVLYQLQLDKRLERYVMANEGFGRHIQTDNIGWQL